MQSLNATQINKIKTTGHILQTKYNPNQIGGVRH